jgi:SCF-associated factor 1
MPFDQMRPVVTPALQNRSVISVHIGDYHYGALTSEGELYTWGQYSKGALGLGDPRRIPIGEPGGYDSAEFLNQHGWVPSPPDVDEPALVKFGRGDGKRKFCFGAATAGWHFGALVIDLEVRVLLLP